MEILVKTTRRQTIGAQAPNLSCSLARWKYWLKLPEDRQCKGPKVSMKFKKKISLSVWFGGMEMLVKTTRSETMRGAEGPEHQL